MKAIVCPLNWADTVRSVAGSLKSAIYVQYDHLTGHLLNR